MKKPSYLILFLAIVTIYSCKIENIAEIYNKCYSEEVTVNGISIKHYIKGFESVHSVEKWLSLIKIKIK